MADVTAMQNAKLLNFAYLFKFCHAPTVLEEEKNAEEKHHLFEL